MLALTPVAQRVTLVQSLLSGSDGDSLAGQNVNHYPDGALFYVAENHNFYQLKKNLNATVVATNARNVVDGIGSSATNGRFVAMQQSAAATLTGGTVAVPGFDFSASDGTFGASSWYFLVTQVTPGGTPGILHAAATAVNIVTVTSASGSDTSSVIVVAVPSKSLA